MTHPLTPREKVELKPCPFCGGEAWLNDYEAKYNDLPPKSRCPQCRSCGASLGYLTTPAKATEAWNRRAALASGSGDHAELARLAEAASEMTAARVALTANSSTWKRLDKATVAYSNAINRIEPATVLALLAENAALRGELDQVRSLHNRATDRSRHWEIASIKADNRATEAERALSEHRITADLLVSTLKADKAEAERKLAEAVGLKHLTDGQIFAAINAAVTITRDRNGVDNGAVCISPEKFRTFLNKEAERG